MNTQTAERAKILFGGYYKPKDGDEQWKHEVADQMNTAICLASVTMNLEKSGAVVALVERVSKFEEIPFHDE